MLHVKTVCKWCACGIETIWNDKLKRPSHTVFPNQLISIFFFTNSFWVTNSAIFAIVRMCCWHFHNILPTAMDSGRLQNVDHAERMYSYAHCGRVSAAPKKNSNKHQISMHISYVSRMSVRILQLNGVSHFENFHFLQMNLLLLNWMRTRWRTDAHFRMTQRVWGLSALAAL